jgi:hypothetical protein
MKRAITDAEIGKARDGWRTIQIGDRVSLRRALVKKHGSLTRAAESLGVNYTRLSATIGGREHIINTVAIIQDDLELSNEQVLTLWPLLRTWPRESRMVS